MNHLLFSDIRYDYMPVNRPGRKVFYIDTVSPVNNVKIGSIIKIYSIDGEYFPLGEFTGKNMTIDDVIGSRIILLPYETKTNLNGVLTNTYIASDKLEHGNAWGYSSQMAYYRYTPPRDNNPVGYLLFSD